MAKWSDKLVEQIEPEVFYSPEEAPLNGAPKHFRGRFPAGILGSELLGHLLLYSPPRGRKPSSSTLARNIQLRCSLEEKEFLILASKAYSVSISSLVRMCCLGMELSPIKPIHLEFEQQLDLLKLALFDNQKTATNKARYNECLTMTTKLNNLLKSSERISLPAKSHPRNQPRITIRFQGSELESLSEGPFVDFVWKAISDHTWHRMLNISESQYDILRKIKTEARGNLDPQELYFQIDMLYRSILQTNQTKSVQLKLPGT